MKKLRFVFYPIAAFFLLSFLLALVTTLFVDTTFVPGDPRRFDPVGSFEDIRRYAGDGAELLSLDSQCVRPDGTIDLKADYVRAAMIPVEYHFVRKQAQPPEDAPPLGAGGSSNGSWYQPIDIDISTPWRFWTVRRQSGSVRTTYMYAHLGMKRDILPVKGNLSETPIPPPTCRFDQLWQIAVERGAPKEAVASINYGADGYRFSIPDSSIRFHFGQDCQLR